MQQPHLRIGDKNVMLDNPQPGQIDLKEIDRRLKVMHRFSNCPDALTVHAHRKVVAVLAILAGEPKEVVDACEHHDDHEAIIGDIPGPLLRMVRQHTHVLASLAHDLDYCIFKALELPPLTPAMRETVHTYDKMAETLEWIVVLKNEPADWNAPLTLGLKMSEYAAIIAMAGTDLSIAQIATEMGTPT